jgi:hypothetical protein
MASRYIGINLGGSLSGVSDDSSTTSKSIELVIDMVAAPKKQDVMLALEHIEAYLLQQEYPLA